jgi:uncharacterized DUF497 family protein
MSPKFEWDRRKATSNLSRHGVSFQEALSVFGDPLAQIFENEGGKVTVSLDLSKHLDSGKFKKKKVVEMVEAASRRKKKFAWGPDDIVWIRYGGKKVNIAEAHDEDHSIEEHWEIIIGHSVKERLLIVCFTSVGESVRIFSARRASRKEREDYEENSKS